MINNGGRRLESNQGRQAMKIIHYRDPVKFQDRIQEYLVRREAENNLLLGILTNVIHGEYSDTEVYMSLLQEAGKTQAAALCTPPYPVILSYENPPPEEKILQALLDDFQSQLGDEFTGLSGNKEFVSPLLAAWEEISGKTAGLEMAQRIYKLERVKEPVGVPGTMRKVEKDDRELLLDWYAGFHRDALGREPDPRKVIMQVNNYLETDRKVRGMMIWVDQDQPVSMAGYSGPTPHGIRVGAVYTPPDQRQKGYASACTAQLSQYLLDQGYEFCFLFTDLGNPTSNHIYQEIGYQPICDVDRYIF